MHFHAVTCYLILGTTIYYVREKESCLATKRCFHEYNCYWEDMGRFLSAMFVRDAVVYCITSSYNTTISDELDVYNFVHNYCNVWRWTALYSTNWLFLQLATLMRGITKILYCPHNFWWYWIFIFNFADVTLLVFFRRLSLLVR